MIVMGDTPSEETLNYWSQNNLVIKGYGPTEATIGTSVIIHNIIQRANNIGSPIINYKMYILDNQLNPVPVGIHGEIYIGGQGVARGYLNRPDLTADRFVPNPFVDQENMQESSNLRLYRTGDLARYLPDGTIEFLGRNDHQVKIRGVRIELGEIESTLSTHGDVAQAVVMAREDEPSNKTLVAYIVPHSDAILSLKAESIFISSSGESFSTLSGETLPSLTESLRNHLTKSIPEHMVPCFFVYVDKIPLTSNGKVDRRSLPAPDLSLRLVGDDYVAPRTPIEEELCHIWKEVLKVEKIGILENFFRLGGHSLLATQVISRIRSTYNVDIPLRALFECPTIATLGETLESLRQRSELSSVHSLLPQVRTEPIPLSFAQQRLWFLDQLLPESALYNIPLALNLKGPLNILALENAINTLLDRHESLRTIFPSLEGKAHQEISPHLKICLTECLVSLIHLKKKEQQLSAEELAKEEAIKHFALATGPLVRIKLLILGKEEHILLITMHHIISDGWSIDILFRELSIFYNAYAEDKELSLPALPIQYADFAIWQREWLQGEVLEGQLSYWKNQLSDIPDLLDLPTDKPRPKELTYKGETHTISLPKEIKEELNRLAQHHQASLFMTLLAMFQILLYRYTGEKNIVVGTPVANRHYKEVEGLIGFFVNTLALKTSFEGTETFIDLLNKVKETTLEAYHHQDVPFEQLVDYLNIPRALNRNPAVQVWFTLETEEKDPFNLFNIHHIAPAETETIFTNFDMKLHVQEDENHINLSFSYMTDLYEQETIKMMASYFSLLIRDVINDPYKMLSEMGVKDHWYQNCASTQQKNTLLSYIPRSLAHEIFEEQAIKYPNRIALRFGDQVLTYKTLNEKANRLAHYLRERKVTADTLVALSLNRSLDMVVGFLGILKAGGAYIPLDYSYPEARLKFILEDTHVPILITTSEFEDKFAFYKGINIFLDREADIVARQPSSNLLPTTSSQNLAYVLYTSGSMGQPKGVMITHNNLVNYTTSVVDHLKKSLPLKFAHVSTFTADLGNTAVYPALLTGSELHIVAEECALDPDLFSSYIHDFKIDCLKIVPSHFDSLLIESQVQKFLPQKFLIFGGDILKPELLEKINTGQNPLEIFNHYGPTEATVGCCMYSIPQVRENYTNSIPIGKPLSNMQMYVLDEDLCPLPPRVKGELYISGRGIGRGYLNEPKLTSESFIPNPFVTKAEVRRGQNLRLYRTGDLAKYLPNGNIEFLGRKDKQVKIRGFRVEIGEVESILQSHGDVNQALVTLQENKLIGYIVAKDFIPTEKELTEFLAAKLPDHMIPSAFVFIERVPLTSNGKIDYKALPIYYTLTDSKDADCNPQNPLEKEICNIFSELLKVENIYTNSNFFKMGGDSILSIRAVSKARQKSIYFTVQDIFNHPTPEELAIIANQNKDQKGTWLIQPEQKHTVGEVPLTPIQHWFFKRKLTNENYYNQAMLLKCNSFIKFELLKKVFAFLVSYHDALRFRYALSSGGWVQESLNPSALFNADVRLVDLSSILDEDLSSHLQSHTTIAQGEINIEKGPLIKVILFECGPERPQRLLIIIHHLVVDGVSWRILLEDIVKIYSQLLCHQSPSLPLKTHSYQQWALSLRKYANTDTLREEFKYWKEVSKAIRRLPTDFKHDQAHHTCTVSTSLNKEETNFLLKTVLYSYNAQINDVLLTALVLAIGEWKKSYDLSLCLEGHGREEIHEKLDLSHTIGWFTSIFPVSLSINDPYNLEDSIRLVKETLEKVPHKGIGYGVLSYLTDEGTNLLTNPSLRFNYLGQWDNALQTEGLFSFSDEFYTASNSKENHPAYLIDINSQIINGCLQFSWGYSTNHYKKNTIEKWSENYIKNIRKIINSCKENIPLRTKPYTHSFCNSPKKPIIFFVHPIGGKVFWYDELCQSLAPSFQCYGIESLFLREDPSQVETIEKLASIYAEEILNIQPKDPFILCGWSFGGIVAYEISQYLIKAGHQVKCTIIIDQNPVIDKQRIQKEVSQIEEGYEDILNNEKKEDLLCKYMHYKCLLRYEISSSVPNLILFASKELAKTNPKGWEKYCQHFNAYTIGYDHFSILRGDNVNFIAQKIILENREDKL